MALLDGCVSRELLEVVAAPLLVWSGRGVAQACSPAVQGKLTGVHLAVLASSGSLPILEHQCVGSWLSPQQAQQKAWLDQGST